MLFRSGQALNPRAAKVDLAKRIITDFHPADAAETAEEEFDRVHKLRLFPEAIAVRPFPAKTWQLARLLVETELVPSMAEARRVIEQGGVRVGEKNSAGVQMLSANAQIELKVDQELVIQVGKRRHLLLQGV